VLSRKRLGILVTAVAVIGIGVYLWVHRVELASLELVAPGFLVLCAVGVGGNLVATTLLSFAMLRKLGCGVSCAESWWLCVVSTTANLLTPARAGAGVRAVYLKRVHGLSYGSFVATLFGYYVLSLLVCSLVAVGCLAWLSFGAAYEGVRPVLVIASLAAVASVGSMFLPRIRSDRNWLLRKLSAVTGAWRELRNEPVFLLRTLGLAVGQFAAFALAFWGASLALGSELGPIEILAVASLGCLSTFVSITPGSLGFYEAVIAFAGASLGVSPVECLAAGLLTRAVLAAFLVVLTPIGLKRLARNTAESNESEAVSEMAEEEIPVTE
jgi:uncharacterized protein (TIRG00374 family)